MGANIRIRSERLAVTFFYVAVLLMSFLVPLKASAISAIGYSGSNVSGVVEDVIPLPGITISGDDPTVPISLSVDGEGILSMTTTTGLTFSGDTSGSSLSFSGSIADLNTALATLQYRTLQADTVTLTAVISNPGEVYFPGNGHMYEVINNGGGISWDDAKIAAELLTKNGASGYLATVTTQAENDYLLGRLIGDGWFGASDSATENDWKWVTGPEAGTSFWAGLGDGAPVASLFSNWSGGEPNDSGGDEDCAQFYSSGSGWNDLPCGGPYLDYYVVEYGAPGDLPTAPESISFDITTTLPVATDIPVASCLDLIDVYNNGADNRYDNLQLTSDIDCTGEDIEPMFSQSDPDFGVIGFRGELDGQGFDLNNVTIDNGGDSDVGLFSSTNGANIHDVTIGGVVNGYECVGGLVGTATDTVFTNVTVNSAINATGQAGGVVGCFMAVVGASSITDSTVTSDVTSGDETGGIVGLVDAENESTFDISGSTYSGEITSTGWAIGGIVGYAETSETSSITIETNTSGELNVPSAYSVGGIVGDVYVEDSSTVMFEGNTVSGDVTGLEDVGGVIGNVEVDTSGLPVTIQNSSITTNVSTTDDDSAGGLVGYADQIHIINSFTTGDVTGDDDETGGLVGEADESTIEESYTTGDVTGSDSFVGGLVGRNSETTILRSYALGDITGDDRVGGLVGANGGYITDSYARGRVEAFDGEVGGLAGRCGREITNSYSTGEVVGSSDVGGLVGYEDGCDVLNSFWDTETSLQADSAGTETGKTTAEMKSKTTFTDTALSEGLDESWDFSDVWKIAEEVNDGYPCLVWQDDACQQDDDDQDGTSSVIEEASPNSGDANNDGTQDSEQDHVVSLVNTVTNSYVSVQLDSSCSLTEATTKNESENTVKDSGFNYSAGFVNFAADCGTPGYKTTVTLYHYGVASETFVVRKHNPNNNSYFTVTSATISEVSIGGQRVTKAVFEITDGGQLDVDGVVNGVIVDPVGLGTLSAGVPNTGLGGGSSRGQR